MTKYKILALFACHTNCLKKYFVNLNNLYNILPYIDNFAFIDSIDQVYALNLKNDIKKINKYKDFIYKDNDLYLDFGKWIYGLENIDFSDYEYILLINDSIILIEDIKNFFLYLDNIDENINLYAYNDSSQLGIYHYQSYFFVIRNRMVNNFIKYFYDKKPKINNQKTLIENMELNLTNIDSNHDCFLKLGKEWNINKNIYWENEDLYKKLVLNNKFHIFKLKKISDIYNNFKYNKELLIQDFDNTYYLNNYKDLKSLDDGLNHFKSNGFSEGRKCSKNKLNILPDYYEEKLKKLNLYCLFCVPENFDIYYYKNIQNDLKGDVELYKLSNKDSIYHYYNIGNEKDMKCFKENNNDWCILKNELYSKYLKLIYDIDYKFPDNFLLNDYLLINKFKNNGIINNLIEYTRNNTLYYNFNQIRDEFNIDNFKIIFENLKNKSDEYIYLYYYNNIKKREVEIPEDFDYNIYSKLYEDLKNLKKKDLIEDHYKYIGNYELRIYNVDQININNYKKYYNDMKNVSNKDAISHYLKYGFKESRIYELPDNFDLISYKFYNYNELKDKNNYEIEKHYFIHGYKNKLKYKLPDDFNFKNYRSLHEELNNYNNTELKKHYILYGEKNNMIFKLPDDFSVEEYKCIFTFLKNSKDEDVINFFYDKGYKTNKIYKRIPDFDPNVYKKLYEDLNILSDNDAFNHFYQFGLKENRIYKIPYDLDIKVIKKFIPKIKDLSDDKAIQYFIKNDLFNNRLKNIPERFNTLIYKYYNKDLKDLNDDLLIEHFRLYGYKEKRKYKLHSNLDLNELKNYNNELKNLKNNEIIKYLIDNNLLDKIYSLPNDFSCKNYKLFNKDLNDLDNIQLKKHYLEIGQKKKYLYKLPSNFDINIYRKYNKDLDKLNNKELFNHFIDFGYSECRKYYDKESKDDLPNDFNFDNYRKMNPELFYFDDNNYLKNHYLTIGQYEGKLYKIPDDFDYIIYKKMNQDLESLDNNKLREHFINYFFKENRKYKLPDDFDYKFYKTIYFNRIKNINNYDLENHYIEIGCRNKYIYKIPSDFDVNIYRKLNNDLEKLNNDQLYFHYFNIGIKDFRLYK